MVHREFETTPCLSVGGVGERGDKTRPKTNNECGKCSFFGVLCGFVFGILGFFKRLLGMCKKQQTTIKLVIELPLNKNAIDECNAFLERFNDRYGMDRAKLKSLGAKPSEPKLSEPVPTIFYPCSVKSPATTVVDDRRCRCPDRSPATAVVDDRRCRCPDRSPATTVVDDRRCRCPDRPPATTVVDDRRCRCPDRSSATTVVDDCRCRCCDKRSTTTVAWNFYRQSSEKKADGGLADDHRCVDEQRVKNGADTMCSNCLQERRPMSIDRVCDKLTVIISNITRMIEDRVKNEFGTTVRSDSSVDWKTGCRLCSRGSRNAVESVTSCLLPSYGVNDMGGYKLDSCFKDCATSQKTEQPCDFTKSSGSGRVTDDEVDCQDHENPTATLVEKPIVEKSEEVVHQKSKRKSKKSPSPSKSKPPSRSSTGKQNTRKRPDSRKNVALC